MKESSKRNFAKLISETKADRLKVRKCVQRGQWRDAETDDMRRLAYQAREDQQLAAQRDPRESLQGDTSDFQPVAFLPEGSITRRAIAKVEVNGDGFSESGTGFLISPDLILTNQHVITDAALAKQSSVIFDYEIDEFGNRRPVSIFQLDPDRFALFSDEEELDFALLAIGNKIQGSAELLELGYCPLSKSPDRHQVGMAVNIIQHPGGVLKSIAVRDNLLTHRTERTLLYETDTLQGSSGAPVFNDSWDVVALHHYGAPSDEFDEDGNPIPRNVNEGVRISRIYRHLETQLAQLPPAKRKLLNTALNLYQDQQTRLPQVSRPESTQLTGKPDSTNGASRLMPQSSQTNTSQDLTDQQEVKFIIPIEVSVRIPAAHPVVPASPDPNRRVTTTQPKLSSAEGKKLDRDYSNRNGFQEDFVQGMEARLEDIVSPLQHRVTPLKPNQAENEKGQLKYQNFSVIMDSEHRFALLTATNIDGDTYKTVDRKTGEIREGESWYIERRIARDAFIDQDFYSAWSHIFDRGHLTRRNDPTWGSATEAKRANADTFHFTNCSPQQWRFNQTVEFWQGIERYVLENGLAEQAQDTNLSVLQGPIYNDATLQEVQVFADDVRIPVAFWKLVLWNGDNGPKAIALIASQDALLDEFRGNAGSQFGLDANVEEFRVSIVELEARSGLDFSALREFDTINDGNAPTVGESSRKLRSWTDIKL